MLTCSVDYVGNLPQCQSGCFSPLQATRVYLVSHLHSNFLGGVKTQQLTCACLGTAGDAISPDDVGSGISVQYAYDHIWHGIVDITDLMEVEHLQGGPLFPLAGPRPLR